MNIEWIGYVDHDYATFYRGASPYHDGGVPFYWRIKSRRRNGKRVWHLVESDDELLTPEAKEAEFPTPEAAQARCEEWFIEILRDNGVEVEAGGNE